MKTPNIFDDIKEKGYVVFNIRCNLQNYYPSVFNKYPGVNITDLKIYDLITIKIFMLDDKDGDARIIEEFIDLTIESIEGDKIIADILKDLPEDFPLSTGDWMEILEEEIVYFIPIEGYLKGMTVN